MKNYEDEENIKEFLLYGLEKEITTKTTTNISKVSRGIFILSFLVSIVFVTFQLGMLITLSVISMLIILKENIRERKTIRVEKK